MRITNYVDIRLHYVITHPCLSYIATIIFSGDMSSYYCWIIFIDFILKCHMNAFITISCLTLISLRPRWNRRHFADDSFKCIFLNENIFISIKLSLQFIHNGLINNIPALDQIMAWCRPSDKPFSEPMQSIWLTLICVTRPQLHWAPFWYKILLKIDKK